ncbi:antibiotic biosynthesis monooxygenase [Spirulina sp. CS-785/01]|uniref:antibiotic biosynthesis monooxygenase n=1 Tax=Spirulina sp. CS-785/01 TaxID=3021716 RepID=UPI00232ECF32|nr:antibiotic biosynthesis monooxygenase [Spirulina sp. CS-785/01]MDB9314158.1 antibiotic biosynthesis monooxygenase [Spirulina sp. CS-785/01]
MNQSQIHQSHHVTAVISHRVRAGREKGYEEWIRGIAAVARQFDGYIGVNILRPEPSASPADYVLVVQFETCDHLNRWLSSDTRKAWIERVKPLIQEKENIQILTGLESWFQQPRHPAPTRYKQAFLVWVGVMIVSVTVGPVIAPLLANLPWLLAQSLKAAVTVGLLVYLIIPQLTTWFKGWLFSRYPLGLDRNFVHWAFRKKRHNAE